MANKWDKRFYKLALEVANWSKDPNSKVGAVIVSPDNRNITVGYNGFPVKIYDSDERLNNRETKLKLMIHAELNAIHNAKISIQGFKMYVTKCPCVKCALSIIQSRIAMLIMPKLNMSSKWIKEHEEALELLNEAQVKIEWID